MKKLKQISEEDMKKFKYRVDLILKSNAPLPSPQAFQRHYSMLDETTHNPKYSEQAIYQALHDHKLDKFPTTAFLVLADRCDESCFRQELDRANSQPQVKEKRVDTPMMQSGIIVQNASWCTMRKCSNSFGLIWVGQFGHM